MEQILKPDGSSHRDADPRKPVRPDGDAGSNWARCRNCDRGASKMSLIRHAKKCRLRNS